MGADSAEERKNRLRKLREEQTMSDPNHIFIEQDVSRRLDEWIRGQNGALRTVVETNDGQYISIPNDVIASAPMFLE